ncbi:FRIGIDA-like protein [Perilla frutescens var. hirtella]|uniref:FRIGIDA-like protein n=1 Tax=Perilla frutescens var. hirtella TaxID=608512 RepID=A0AAD4JQA8_PERFH|nr:FRIGIDA-like protein [Perilla frutescens var. frutescens]KAH6788107.1 FRIGIDA-like protein [Perilla frutescens var. hirtella]KAH6838042.1 FRIGIDA-like protein [Perilla frutescens var. hirtella]
MGSLPDPGELTHPPPPPSFDDFQRQTSLMTSCTLLWKELSDHFSSLEQDLIKKSDALKAKVEALNQETQQSLKALDSRESSISKSLSVAYETLEKATKMSISFSGTVRGREEDPEVDDSEGLLMKLKSFCHKMAVKEFWIFVTSRKKELELFRSELPKALADCVDPPRFVLEAISEDFPVASSNNSASNSCDLGWACVLLLESLIPVMVDPVLGKERMLVTPSIKGKAEEIAEAWKKSLEERGGIENVKTPDVHTFLQHLVTFGIVKEEDVDLYRKLVVALAWRKQMPKLAVSLGLGDKMPDMIEELIGRGQQVDAVHFTYEAGLADKFPPVPLLKAFLKDAKKTVTSILEDPNNSGRAAHMAAKKEQSAIRAVLKCIEEYKLEAAFPPEDLKKRLEHLERAKIEKKKPASPAAKRTRASTGGPMPPAKAGRSTNAYVSSFPSPPTYIRSPPSHTQYSPTAVPAYPAVPAVYGHGSRSPPYVYSPEAPPAAIVGSYPVSPVSFPAYGGYSNGMAPAYQQAYY